MRYYLWILQFCTLLCAWSSFNELCLAAENMPNGRQMIKIIRDARPPCKPKWRCKRSNEMVYNTPKWKTNLDLMVIATSRTSINPVVDLNWNERTWFILFKNPQFWKIKTLGDWKVRVENWPHFCSSFQPDNWWSMLIVLYRKQRQLSHISTVTFMLQKSFKNVKKNLILEIDFLGEIDCLVLFSNVVKIPGLLKQRHLHFKANWDKAGILTKQDLF